MWKALEAVSAGIQMLAEGDLDKQDLTVRPERGSPSPTEKLRWCEMGRR